MIDISYENIQKLCSGLFSRKQMLQIRSNALYLIVVLCVVQMTFKVLQMIVAV